MMKKLWILPIFCVLLLSGCVGPNMAINYPPAQLNSQWKTEDDSIFFSVGEKKNDPIYGYIQTNTERVNVRFCMSVYITDIEIYPADTTDFTTQPLSTWRAVEIRNSELTVRVLADDVFFKQGTEFTLYRVEKESENS